MRNTRLVALIAVLALELAAPTGAVAGPKKIHACQLAVTCPSNVLGNTATANGTNLLLQGAGCNVEHNLAPP